MPIKKGNDTTKRIDSLPWKKIIETAGSQRFAEELKDIPKDIYQFAAKKSNREALIKSAWKSLIQTDPKKATKERAEVVADMMQIFAQKMLTKKIIKKKV